MVTSVSQICPNCEPQESLQDLLRRANTSKRCQDCGLDVIESRGQHVCALPIMREAVGLPLTEEEDRFLRWLAGKEKSCCQAFTSILLKVHRSK